MRNDAALLAEKLNQLTPQDQDYYVNFSNSGAESIEAAIKHAYKVQAGSRYFCESLFWASQPKQAAKT